MPAAGCQSPAKVTSVPPRPVSGRSHNARLGQSGADRLGPNPEANGRDAHISGISPGAEYCPLANPTASGRTNVQVQCWCDRRMAVPSVFGRLRNCRSPELPLGSLRLKPESKLLPQCRNQRRYRGIRFFRRLRVRYDKRADIHEAFLSLGCAADLLAIAAKDFDGGLSE